MIIDLHAVQVPIQDRYNQLKPERTPYELRAEKYAMYTLGYIQPLGVETGNTAHYEMGQHYNVTGGQLVNHLSNKYASIMFPISRSFFKLSLEDEVLAKIIKSADNPEGLSKAQMDTELVKLERKGKKQIEVRGARTAFLECFKHLIVSGNCLAYYPDKKKKKGKVQVYALDEYVVIRDLDGNVIEVITRDAKNLITLDPDLRQQIVMLNNLTDPDVIRTTKVDLYTRILLREDGKWDVQQAVDGVDFDEITQIKDSAMRWLPLTWNRVRREHYGRGHVEDYSSVFHAAEVLNEALITGAAITLDFKFLVDPASVINVTNLNNSPTGTFHYGRKDDINLIEKVKLGDIQAIGQILERIEGILKSAFLWNTQRQAERVTAEEVRMNAQELQTAHGGVFGSLADTMQRPVAYFIMEDISPKIKDTEIFPQIVTGIDAMGRGADNDRLREVWMDMAAASQVPESILQGLNLDWTELFKANCNGRDVDYTKIVMDEAQIKAKADAEKKAMQEEEAAKQGPAPAPEGQQTQPVQ